MAELFGHYCARLTQHISRFVNLALIEIHREVVVNTHRCSIIQIACHNGLFLQGKEPNHRNVPRRADI